LCDTDKAVSLVYGAAEVSSSRPSRISYLIDGNRQIKKVYESVTPADHPGEVLKDLS
jgi:peroxiredoxin